MLSYCLNRLAATLLSLFVVSVLVFLMVRSVPGDVVDASIGNNTGSWAASPEQLAALRAEFGLDKSIAAQYLDWIGAIFTGDLGTSWRSGRAVVDVIASPLMTSLELALLATVISMLIGIVFGVVAALRHGGWADYLIRVGGIMLIAVPVFWLGSLSIMFLSLTFGWIPSVTYQSFLESPLANLEIMFLPAITLGLSFAASLILFTRSAMLDVLRQDFIVTAMAKGLPRGVVVRRHGVRNALIPVVTAAGLQFGVLVGGLVVVEKVFNIPGLGRVFLTAVEQRDYPVVQMAVVIFAAVVFVANFLVDLLYARLDPRVRIGR